MAISHIKINKQIKETKVSKDDVDKFGLSISLMWVLKLFVVSTARSKLGRSFPKLIFQI